jgi:hypothetical protein
VLSLKSNAKGPTRVSCKERNTTIKIQCARFVPLPCKVGNKFQINSGVSPLYARNAGDGNWYSFNDERVETVSVAISEPSSPRARAHGRRAGLGPCMTTKPFQPRAISSTTLRSPHGQAGAV